MKLNNDIKAFFTVTLLTVCLTACGGGGGGSNGNDGGNGGDNGGTGTANSAPQFSSAANASLAENQSGVVYTATATDADGDSLIFSISAGADQTAFSIDSASGELSLTSAADFETPSDANADGAYEITLAVNDGKGASDQLALTITVTNNNEAPSFTSATSISVDENMSGVVYTATATDADGDSLVFSISAGADQTAFSIDGASGELSLTSAADFETPSDANADGVYELTLKVDDGKGASDELALTITQTPPNNAPLASILFPPAKSVTDSSTITLRGTAEDPEGDAIVLLRVNGVAASSTDGFATWQATVPLVFGVNALVVEAEDSAQNNNPEAATASITSQRQFVPFMSAAVFDSNNNQVFITDRSLNAVLVMDAATGERTLVSSSNRGSGPNLPSPLSITLDTEGRCVSVLPAATRCALVVSDNVQAVHAVDLVTGDRAVVSGKGRGTGPSLSLPDSIFMDSSTSLCPPNLLGATHCALVPDRGKAALIAVDLDTGNRAIMAASNRGVGPNFVGPKNPVLDPDNACALVLNNVSRCLLMLDTSLADSIIAVDMDTGNRAALSGTNRGSGPSFGFVESMVLDPANRCASALPDSARCALVLNGINRGGKGLFAVDLATGNRVILSDNNRGLGAKLDFPLEVLLDTINGRVFIVDQVFDNLSTVDLISGDRGLFPDHRVGSGPGLDLPVAVHLVEDSAVCNRVLDGVSRCGVTTDSDLRAIVAVDLDTGNHAIIANAQRGSGANFVFPSSSTLITADRCASLLAGAEQCAIVLDSGLDALVLVDLASGDRRIVSDANQGSGPTIGSPSSIVAIDSCSELLTAATNCVLVTDFNLAALLAVDLETGNRAIISSNNRGAGPAFIAPFSLALMENCNSVIANTNPCALVADFSLGALVAVDLSTGERAIVASENRGSGAGFNHPVTVVIDTNNRCHAVLSNVTHCALVSEATSGALVAVNLETGNRAILLDDSIGQGPSLTASPFFVLDNENNIGILVDQTFSALIVIDFSTQQRVIVAWGGKKGFNTFLGT